MTAIATDIRRTIQGVEAQRRALDAVLADLRSALKKLDAYPTLDGLKQEATRIANGHGLRREGTQYERVAAFLVSTDNEPKTARELAEGAGANHNSLAAILYTTHKNCFVSENQKGFKRRLVWCLTSEALDDARQHLTD